MQALPGTLSCGCCDCRYGHDRWALRTRLTCSIRLRISAGTHMRTENVAAFEKNCFFLLKVLQSEYTEYKGRKAPMPRPPRCRRICGAPQVDTFCPNGCGNTEPILLTLDEYEVIRLVDLEQQTHEQCAAQMDISRSTVQEIYEGARRKIAACLVHGKPLHITGGKLPHLRRTGGSSLRPLLPDAENQHGKIRQNLQRRFHYENCSYL